MKSRQEIEAKLIDILVNEFELERDEIKPTTHLYTDLDLDSIDTVDLVIHLQEIIGRKIEPETFKSVRTIEDVVNAVEQLVNQ